MTTVRADRVIDLDVTRAVAMIGVVVMNYHGYLILQGGSIGKSNINRFFDPFTGPLATRFAATFVVVAGMGITLMTNRGRITGDRARRSIDRWVLIRRGFLLYAIGFVFEWIWSGTILFYYGAMFMVGALLFLLATRWLVVVGAAAAVAAAAIQWGQSMPSTALPGCSADGTRGANTVHREGWCSTPSSTARTRCCHGSRSCARE